MNGTSRLFERGAQWYRASTPWTEDVALLTAIVERIAKDAPVGLSIEVGAGGCDIARAAGSLGVGPWLCTDVSFEMLASAEEIDGWKVQAEGGALPVRDGAAGVVACRSALHYVGADRGLREWRRVLASNGTMIIAQKVADDLRLDMDWYREVQVRRSTAPREWYFTESLVSQARCAGLKVVETASHRGVYQVDLGEWASRSGVLTPQVSRRLLELAERGRIPQFSERTGFRLDGTVLTMRIKWCILVCRIATGSDPIL